MERSLTILEISVLDWFETPRSRSRIASYGVWDSDDLPRPNIARTIDQLLASGHLRELTPEEKLIDLDNPTLKSELKTRSLKTSGNKKELIARLIEDVSAEDLKRLTKGSDLVELTTLGHSALESAREHDQQVCRVAIDKSVVSLNQHDIVSALQEVFTVAISRGGIASIVPRSFRDVDDPPSPEELSSLFSSWPESLGTMDQSAQDALRIATAMQVLWNEDPTAYYPATAPLPKLPLSIAANHLWNEASRRGRAVRIKGSVILEHYRSQEPMCGKCTKLVGRSFPSADLAPHLPLEGCMTTDGCPLQFETNWDEDSHEIDLELLTLPSQDSPTNLSDSLREASRLLAEGLIDDTEFDALKSEILRRLSGG